MDNDIEIKKYPSQRELIIKKHCTSFFTLSIFLLFLLFRIPLLTVTMSNSDAWRWHTRSIKFLNGIKSGDFKETYQRYHPGVTLMWLTSAVNIGYKYSTKILNLEYKTLENTDGFLIIDTSCKALLITIQLIMLIIIYKYIKNIFGRYQGLIFTALVSSEIYLVGIGVWYHLTSLEAFFAFASLLSILNWRNNRKNKDIILSGVFSALAVLTKFSSALVILFIPLIIYITLRKDNKSKLFKYTLLFLSVILISVFILFPALWVDPLYVIRKIWEAGANAVAGEYGSVYFAEYNPHLFYIFTLLLKLSPFTLVLFIFSLLGIRKEIRFETKTIIYYLFANLLLLLISEQKIERYIIAVLLPILLICSLYIWKTKLFVKHVVLLLFVIANILLYITYWPFPSLYYSPIFGGIKFAKNIGILDTNGEYFSQSALELNKKGRDINVFVPGDTHTFSPYFKGKYTINPNDTYQYAVISHNSRTYQGIIPQCEEEEKTYSLHKQPLVTIYKCQ